MLFFLLLSLLPSKKIDAQIYYKTCGTDSIEVCLFKIESEHKSLKAFIIELDSLVTDSIFDNRLFKIIATTILKNGITEGYDFVLNNSNKFKWRKTMKASDILNGKTPVIWDAMKSMRGDRIKRFIDYILYSDYLNQELSQQQLEHLSSIVNYNRDALYHATHNKSLRETNLHTIYKINTKD